jgi:hypothetical protein
MAPLQQELSRLEAEPLEVILSRLESKQESSLDTLTTLPGEVKMTALWTGTSPVNGDSSCCCCCCTVCCCCAPACC